MGNSAEKRRETRILEFLQNTIDQRGNPEQDRIIQTHASFVLLLGSEAIKIKKPVNFGFLDFSTLELRKYYCDQEILLNRRTCQNIYLEVIPIYETDQGLSFEGGDSVYEYGVRMNRMKEGHFLKNILKTKTLSERQIERICETLLSLYEGSPWNETIENHGRTSFIKISTDENFEQINPFIGSAISNPIYNALKYYTNSFLERRAELFQSRIRNRRIKDCHGDLHLEHIALSSHDVCIFDCIEFNDRFRFGDVASDVAFLSMDLDYNHSKELGNQFVRIMGQTLNDPEMTEVLDFYKCYRAIVRGKVHAFMTEDETLDSRTKARERQIATSYFQLALHYATVGTSPMVFAMTGMIGSGKSAVARTVSHWLDTDYVSSDIIRKEIAGMPLYDHPSGALKKEMYSSRMNERTYAEVLHRSSRSLGGGRSVIIDASFRTRAGRDLARELANIHNVPIVFIETMATDQTIRRRLQARGKNLKEVSDARIEDFESIKSKYEPYDEENESGELLQITTNGNLEDTLQKLLINLSDLRIDLK